MDLIDSQRIVCPYCGESFEVGVDISAGDQQYIEDCEVCCRPIELRLHVDGVSWRLEVLRDDE